MEKMILNSNEYDAVAAAYRDKHGYDDMSDEEKEAFDRRLDQVLERADDEADPREDPESSDPADDPRTDSERLRDELKSHYGYDDMSDAQKQAFDEKLDEVMGTGSAEDDDPDQPEKVLRRTR